MQHAWTCGMDIQLGHAARTRRMDKQHKHVAWTDSIDMKQGHAARTCSMDMLYGHTAWTRSMDLYMYCMYIHVHGQYMDVQVHVHVQKCTLFSHIHARIYCKYLYSKISFYFVSPNFWTKVRRNETKHSLGKTKFHFPTKQKNYISWKP
jgi:hypothetical protein